MENCANPGCERPGGREHGGRRGYCWGHYKRSLRGADMTKPIPLRAARGTYVGLTECLTDGCTNKPVTRGRCGTHDGKRVAKQRESYAALSSEEKRTRSVARYGLTAQAYDELLKLQGGGCAICGCPPGVTKRGRSLPVDHDHACCPGTRTCGRCVRGILCVFCNNALGGYESTGYMPEPFRAYLQRIVRVVDGHAWMVTYGWGRAQGVTA